MSDDPVFKCSSCGASFTWKIPDGQHHPKDCPEGLDGCCPGCDPAAYDQPKECPSCRPKEDMQRS